MRFDILTIFPEVFEGYFNESIIKRARQRRLLDIRTHDLRRWAKGRHRQVDDRPFGGGPGMVMMVEPFYRALRALMAVRSTASKPKKTGRPQTTRIILMSAKGKTFSHQEAVRLAKYDRLILLCGRYEGVDERVAAKLADEELSIGNYVLTGGELPAMVVVDAVSRQLPGVLGKAESLAQESHSVAGVTEYPQYTRPEVFRPTAGGKGKTSDKTKSPGKSWRVPKILLSGDHKKIADWRKGESAGS